MPGVAGPSRRCYNPQAIGNIRFPRAPRKGSVFFDKHMDSYKHIPTQKMTTEQINEQYRKLLYIKETNGDSRILQRSKDLAELVNALGHQLRSLFGPDAVAVLINLKGRVAIPLVEGVDRAILEAEIAQKTSPLSLAVENNESVYIPNLAGSEIYYSSLFLGHLDSVYRTTIKDYEIAPGGLTKTGLASVMVTPVFSDPYRKKHPLGVLLVGSKRKNAWDALVDLPPLRQLANFSGTALTRVLRKERA